MDKSAIRKEYRELRKGIPVEEREAYAKQISDKVFDFLNANPSIRHIHIFLPILGLYEINTFPIVERLTSLGYFLYTSFINPESNDLDTLEINHEEGYVTENFGIPVPKTTKVVGSDRIQMVLIPLLAFDIKGNRLGYGKGYYDRYLDSIGHKIIKAGLSFFPPVIEIPKESHDIGLDICITPEEIYHFYHS